ncbi:MAG: AlwI family type II restriction endonuclease [Ilumatobacteraceae bacterium]
MKPWQLGNTSVRSGLRTRDALIALAGSNLEGQLRGRDGDKRFRQLLGGEGVVELGEDETESVGRKFRSALNRLGFLYPEAPKGVSQTLIGPLDFITPSGRRFIDSESIAGQQECFLRALVGMSFDFGGSTYRECGDFSPLLHVLRVLDALEKRTGDSRTSFVELTVFIQTTNHMDSISRIVDAIIQYREKRENSANKKKYDNGTIDAQRNREAKPLTAQTYRDYGDMNLRWLRATGLFRQRGRGIGLSEHRKSLTQQLRSFIVPEMDVVTYWKRMTLGPALPVDDLSLAIENLEELSAEARSRNLGVPTNLMDVATSADAAVMRHNLEEAIAVFDESQYAGQQAQEWENISKYLAAMEDGRVRLGNADDESVVVPNGEAPAYLEWAIWRAFLAINRLKSLPSESRGFKVDRDFLPVGHAPGGIPDLVFEFEKFVLVVEVTLSTSSRQEATEGVSVRNHVFQVTQAYSQRGSKPVFGLFIAPKLDPNTLMTFQGGAWIVGDDEFRVDVVPMTIGQFNQLFIAMFKWNFIDNNVLHKLVAECIAYRDESTMPRQWRESIGNRIDLEIQQLSVSVGT